MAPSGIILEPNEKVILATRPLFLWEPLVIIDILLLILALYFTRTQAALLLDRVQDASISHPFPLAMIRDYGVLHLESAGEHAQERLEGGTHELAMTGSTKFYQALTDAQTPN